MKKILLLMSVCILLIVTSNAHAIDFVWKDKYGNRYFQCAGNVVGGQSKVKELDLGLYRVRSALLNREISATSYYHAAQIGCGESPEMDSTPQEPAEEQTAN
jgi:hypothetical protein